MSNNPNQLGPARMPGVPKLYRLNPGVRTLVGTVGDKLLLGILPTEPFLPERMEVTLDLQTTAELFRELTKVLFANPAGNPPVVDGVNPFNYQAPSEPPAELPPVRVSGDSGPPTVPPV